MRPAPRLPALTGIRILAALAVYASHVGAPHGAPEFVTTFFASGYNGVTLFFVLSGFVLAINYFDGFRRPSAGKLFNYSVARFARIYPLYLLLLLYVMVRQQAFGESSDGWWYNALALQAWSADLTTAYSFDPPSWSIGVEFFLYACFPLLVPLLARLRKPKATLVAAAGVAAAMVSLVAVFVIAGWGNLPWTDPGSAHRWLYRTPLTRLGDFVLGILAAQLYFQTRGDPRVGRWGASLAIGAMLVGICFMAWPGLLFTAWSWDVAYALPAAVFIFGLAVAPVSLLARGLSLPFMVLLGEASYAFYLVHAPAIGLFGGAQWATITSVSTVAFEAMMLGAIIALSVGLHVTFEGPARTYVKRVFAWRPKGARASREPAGEAASP